MSDKGTPKTTITSPSAESPPPPIYRGKPLRSQWMIARRLPEEEKVVLRAFNKHGISNADIVALCEHFDIHDPNTSRHPTNLSVGRAKASLKKENSAGDMPAESSLIRAICQDTRIQADAEYGFPALVSIRAKTR